MTQQVIPEWVNYIAAFFIIGIVMIIFKTWLKEVLIKITNLDDRLTTMQLSMANDYTKTESFTNEKIHTNTSRKDIWKELRAVKENITDKISELDKTIALGFQEVNIKLDEHISRERINV